jgi:hypothetical protein
MKFEKINNGLSQNLDKMENNPESALMPEEREAKLQEEIKETQQKLKKLTEEFSILSEEDYFESRQKLELILDKIKELKAEQQKMSDKLEDILKLKEDLSREALKSGLENDGPLKN